MNGSRRSENAYKVQKSKKRRKKRTLRFGKRSEKKTKDGAFY
jgi:hypothetical protein